MYTLGYNAPTTPAYADTASMTSPLGHVAIRFNDDATNMNWLRDDHPYAAVSALGGIASEVTMERNGDLIRTTVTLTNTTDKTVFTTVGDIGITLPLEDRYYDESGEYSIDQHCNTHLFCGGTSSWVLALRMSGRAPHLGLVLTEGALANYSTSRDFAHYSNDRGCFVLHPEAMEFAAGQSHRISWTIFPCQDREDFFAQTAQLNPRFIRATWDHTVTFPGRTVTLTIAPAFEAARVTVNGQEAVRQPDGRYRFEYTPDAEAAHTADWLSDRIGEHVFTIEATALADEADDPNDVDAEAPRYTARTRVFVSESVEQVLADRARFIIERQQYRGTDPHLKGAYLAYDNEEERQYYYARSSESGMINDYNAGRERAGMANFLASYARALRDGVVAVPQGLAGGAQGLIDRISESLADYRAFVARELVDPTTGYVYNDSPRDDSYKRLYNAPWYATFFDELYKFTGDSRDLDMALAIVRNFYEHDSWRFYTIEMPILAVTGDLKAAGRDADYADVKAMFLRHARTLAQLGLHYPKHEVNYEQSIVAPAASVIAQAALLGEDKDLAAAALQQAQVLDQFQGCQPDAHLGEVSIRHWDGFWFGKRKQYGDTLPHYWSGLTGNVFDLIADLVDRGLLDAGSVVGDSVAVAGNTGVAAGSADSAESAADTLRRRALASRYANLQLFFPGGRASAAFLFPYSVNGERAHFADPMANDQDWALYFILRSRLAGRQG
ncbi:hypothetical protein [Bifidobacterium oedipodis]|uniref:Six-hairpin glycosidase n=1 Tax=Bifidobacterium oedipodis TaxID=2675322 RepID=A0A7Y0ERE0_9BIFI|nr:hypothetical protein [Bifidobacterium sp. DSM 109957]NMM94573.1 hypothetical protein [Bifidobacterium sp. DSM 109957]